MKSLWRDVRAGQFALAGTRLAVGPSAREWIKYLHGDYVLPREMPILDGDLRA